MDVLKLCFLLLLPQTVCFESGVTLVKTVGKDPDVTPLCTNKTQAPIDMIVCTIRTERMGGEKCHLLYRHGHGFINECGSKFRLVTINQTVFVHMSSLTAADGGSHSCECVNSGRTFTYHLNITVEENEEVSSFIITFHHALVGVAVFVAVTSVILGFICKKLCHCCFRSETLNTTAEDEPEETYTSLQRPDRDLYQTIFTPQHDAARSSAGTDGGFNQNYDATDPDRDIYENV